MLAVKNFECTQFLSCFVKKIAITQFFFDWQVRRSFLEELGIHNNWTVVDMIFREFYTGSDEDLSPEERKILESLFVTKFYVQREIEYRWVSQDYLLIQNIEGVLQVTNLNLE